ncbi:MAG: LysM peptidoglycan-binding domain-containing protein [Elusimicrobia bacterium]|nr:LysM peptidoglycan-binding domain-containing protein [Elusimicrobiota bacterium]
MRNVFFAGLFFWALTGGVSAQQVQLLETNLPDNNSPAGEKAAPPKPGLPASKAKGSPKAAPAKPAAPKAAAAPSSAPPAAKTAVKPGAAPVKHAAPKPVPAAPAAAAPAPAAVKGGFSVEKKHTVSGGETLWALSGKYYGDPYIWGKIYNANLQTVGNPDRIYPGEELLIPGITEKVAPARSPHVISGADTVREGELSVTDVEQQDKPAAAAQRRPSAAAISEELNSFADDELSSEMPEDQKEWSGALKVVPDNWTGDGFVTAKEKTGADSVDEGFSFNGETVVIQLSGQAAAAVKKGDRFSIYLRGSAAFDKKGNKLGRELQPAGTAEVLSADGRTVKARITDASSSIRKGMVVKLDGR